MCLAEYFSNADKKKSKSTIQSNKIVSEIQRVRIMTNNHKKNYKIFWCS